MTRRLGRWWQNVGRLRIAVVLLPIPGLAAWFGISAAQRQRRPPVILITIDALRADRLGCYGSRANLTPNLDRFARDAIVFEHAFACAPWTANSFVATFAARYPHEAGMAPPAAQPPRPTPTRPFRLRGVGDAPPLLPEILREAGYVTAAEIANPYLHPRLGWSRGFDYFRNEHSAPPEPVWTLPGARRAFLGWRHTTMVGWFFGQPYMRRAARRMAPAHTPARDRARALTMIATSWLREHGEARAFFLWVHYMDPHEPYLPPALPPAARAKLPPQARRPLYCTGVWLDRGEAAPEVSAPVQAAVRMLYDYEVRYADRWVGALLEHLRRSGLYERSLIIVSADHGDELWDHGGLGHGQTLYEELLRVPLLVKLPGRGQAQRVRRQVRLLDLMPTVLQVTGVRYRGPQRGRSLLAALEERDPPRPLFAEGLLYGDEQKCLRTERYKVIYHAATGRMEVYDLRADPGEKHDLGRNERIAARERAALRAWMARAARVGGAAAAQVELTPDLRERLRSLGYVTQ